MRGEGGRQVNLCGFSWHRSASTRNNLWPEQTWSAEVAGETSVGPFASAKLPLCTLKSSITDTKFTEHTIQTKPDTECCNRPAQSRIRQTDNDASVDCYWGVQNLSIELDTQVLTGLSSNSSCSISRRRTIPTPTEPGAPETGSPRARRMKREREREKGCIWATQSNYRDEILYVRPEDATYTYFKFQGSRPGNFVDLSEINTWV